LKKGELFGERGSHETGLPQLKNRGVTRSHQGKGVSASGVEGAERVKGASRGNRTGEGKKESGMEGEISERRGLSSGISNGVGLQGNKKRRCQEKGAKRRRFEDGGGAVGGVRTEAP